METGEAHAIEKVINLKEKNQKAQDFIMEKVYKRKKSIYHEKKMEDELEIAVVGSMKNYLENNYKPN